MTHGALDVVYVVNRYPELSQTFVLDEVSQVVQHGIRVAVFALIEPIEPSEEQPSVAGTVVPKRSGDRSAFLGLVVRNLLRRPRGLIRAVRHTAPTERESRRLLWSAMWIAKQLQWQPPRRIHAHFANEPSAVGVVLANLLGVPFSLQAHGYDVHAHTYELERSLSQADPAIAPCHDFANHLRGMVVDADRIVTIPVAVDPGRFRRTTPYGQSSPPIIACVARLVPKKGIDVLLRALAILRERGIQVHAEIVGTGPLLADLEDLRDRLHLGDVVTFHGAAGRASIKELLERAWLFVLPCRVAEDGDRDSQPVALKEAMAMGIPVVSTNVAGIPELVDAPSGVLVQPDDDRALAEAMAALLARPNLDRAAMGEHARQRIIDSFAFDVTIPQLIDAWGLAGTS